MITIRVAAFTVSAVLLAELLGPAWGWYLLLWLLCLTSFSVLSFIAALISFSLAVGLLHSSEGWYLTLAVFTGVTLLRSLMRRNRAPTAVYFWRSGFGV